MKVILNVDSLRPPRTGIGIYTQHLLEQLLGGAGVDCVFGFSGGQILETARLESLLLTLASGSEEAAAPSGAQCLSRLRSAVRRIPGTYQLRQNAREFAMRRVLRVPAREGFVYHEPNYVPLAYPGRLVITVHDLSHIRHPEFHPKERVEFLEKNLAAGVARADRILVDSHFVADEVKDVFRLPDDKVVVTHLAAEREFHPRSEDEVGDTLRAHRLRHRGYVLSVGTLEPRKNLERLVQAYEALPANLRGECPLVLVGARGWRDSQLLSRVQALEAKGQARRLGYVPRPQLYDLYAAAAAFAYPSLYEGFGLPVLEAFASGTPVLTSCTTSLKEVSAGAALEVDPWSTESLVEGLRSLVGDRSLAERRAHAGLERAKEFSWPKCAEQTVAVYRALS